MIFIALSIPSLVHGGGSNDGYRLVATMTDNDGPVCCLTLHPNRNLIIHGDATGKLYFRDASTGQLFRKIKAHEAPVRQLSFNSNGTLLLSASEDGEIKIYDFEKDAIVQSMFSPDYSGISFVLFSIADGFVYFNSGSRIFKTRSDFSQKVTLLTDEKQTISDAVVSDDRSYFLYAVGNQIKVSKTRTDEFTQSLTVGQHPIHRMRFVNKDTLAVWCDDGTITFRHFNAGQLEAEPINWMKAGTPGDMCFSKDGNRMVSGNVGNWARVMQPFDKAVIQELFAHKNTVTTAIFGRNDGVLFTGSKDGTVRVWKDPKLVAIEPIADKFPPVVGTQPIDSGIASTILPTATVSLQGAHTQLVKTPLVEKKSDNTPVLIGGRDVNQAGIIHISTPKVTIFVFDNSSIDGDTLSLYFNDEWIMNQYGVTKMKKAIELSLRENQNNYLVLFANNLGKTPPNTAAIQFFDGRSDRIFKLSSDLSRCSALNFIYQPTDEKNKSNKK